VPCKNPLIDWYRAGNHGVMLEISVVPVKAWMLLIREIQNN
jgi:hypothetical protein